MSTSAAAPLQSEAVAERPAKTRGGDAVFLLALGLAELAWVAFLVYGLLTLVD
jgi:hypothetical protein